MLDGLVLGLHLATWHAPDRPELSGNTPGAYARTAEGWTGGLVRNSFGRWSAYGGRQLEVAPHVSLAVGVISGYERRGRPCTDSERWERGWTRGCWTGITKRAVSPVLSPSLHAELAPGLTVRLNYAPRWSRPDGSEALNLSAELRW